MQVNAGDTDNASGTPVAGCIITKCLETLEKTIYIFLFSLLVPAICLLSRIPAFWSNILRSKKFFLPLQEGGLNTIYAYKQMSFLVVLLVNYNGR